MMTTITNNYSIVVYFIIALTGVLFYFHRFIEPDSNQVVKIRAEHSLLKKVRNSALLKLEKKPSDSLLVIQYLNAKKKADIAWSELKKAKKAQSFFGFRSLHYFFERFGLASLIFVYGIFNLVRSFYYDRKNVSSKVFHAFIVSVGFFYFFWVFNTFQDFSKSTYFLITLASSCFVTFGVGLYTKYKQSYINSLKGDIREISRFTVLNTKPGKQKDMFNMFEKLTKSKL